MTTEHSPYLSMIFKLAEERYDERRRQDCQKQFEHQFYTGYRALTDFIERTALPSDFLKELTASTFVEMPNLIKSWNP